MIGMNMDAPLTPVSTEPWAYQYMGHRRYFDQTGRNEDSMCAAR